jgi:Protein of unknown function (DUF3540)
MSQASARVEAFPSPRVEDYLGPAEVTGTEGRVALAFLPSGQRVHAELALALPYQPLPGDTLLVIGRGASFYAIGVLHGAGATSLELHGDVHLHAVDGRLHLSGDKGVELRGPEVDVAAGALRMVADAVVQRFTSVCQRVSDMLSVHARQTHTLVEEGSYAQSKSATILTEETMTINGKEIHLG